MNSLKAVLMFLFISVYASNIVIFGGNPNQPGIFQTSQSMDDPEDTIDNIDMKLYGNTDDMILAETSSEPKRYFQPSKSICDYYLTDYDGSIKVSDIVKSNQLVLFVHLDHTNREFDKHIEILNKLRNDNAYHLYVFGILTEKTDFIKKIRNDAYFLVSDPADDFWNNLLLNVPDQYKQNKNIEIPFTKFFVANEKVIDVIDPSVVIGPDMMDIILSKCETGPSDCLKHARIYDYPLKIDDQTEYCSDIVKEHHVVLFVFINPTKPEFVKHIEDLNELYLNYLDRISIIGIFTKLAYPIYKIRRSAKFPIYNPANDLWDILLFNARDLYKHIKLIKIPFTKYFVFNGQVIEVFEPWIVIGQNEIDLIFSKLDTKITKHLKDDMILAETSSEPKRYFQPSKSICDYYLTDNEGSVKISNIIKSNQFGLFVHIDPTNHGFAEHIEELNKLHTNNAYYLHIFGILTEITDIINKIRFSANFLVCDPADDFWKNLLLNVPDQYKQNKNIEIPFTKFFVANEKVIDVIDPSVVIGPDMMDIILSKCETGPSDCLKYLHR